MDRPLAVSRSWAKSIVWFWTKVTILGQCGGRHALCVNYLRHCNRQKWASHVTQLNPNHHVESPGVTLLPWKLLYLRQWKTTLFLNFLAFHINRPFSFGSSGQTRPRGRPRGWSWLPSEKQRHIGAAHTRAQAYLPYWIWGRIFVHN